MGSTLSKPRESTSVDVEGNTNNVGSGSYSLASFSPFSIFSYTGVSGSAYLHAALYSFWRWGSGMQYHPNVQAIKSESERAADGKSYIGIDISSPVLEASNGSWFSTDSGLNTSSESQHSYSSGATIVEIDDDIEHDKLTIVNELGQNHQDFGSIAESYPDYLTEDSVQLHEESTMEPPVVGCCDLQSVSLDLETSNSSIELPRDLAMVTTMTMDSVEELNSFMNNSFAPKKSSAELDAFYSKPSDATSYTDKTTPTSSRRTSSDVVEYNPCVTAEDFVKVPKYDYLCADETLLAGFYAGFDATSESLYAGKPLMDLLLPENIAKSRLSKTSGESVLQKRSLSPGSGEVVKTVADVEQTVEAVSGKKNLILNRIFVWKLDKETTEEDLTNTFDKFGKIQEIQIIYGRNNRQRRYGFVTFKEIEDCKNLLGKKEELELLCREQKIFFSEAFFQPKREEKVVCNVCKKNNVKKTKPKKSSFYDRPKPARRYATRNPIPPSLDYNGFQRYPLYPTPYRHAPRKSIW